MDPRQTKKQTKKNPSGQNSVKNESPNIEDEINKLLETVKKLENELEQSNDKEKKNLLINKKNKLHNTQRDNLEKKILEKEILKKMENFFAKENNNISSKTTSNKNIIESKDNKDENLLQSFLESNKRKTVITNNIQDEEIEKHSFHKNKKENDSEDEEKSAKYILDLIEHSVKMLRKSTRTYSPGLSDIEKKLKLKDSEQYSHSELLKQILAIGTYRSNLTTYAARKKRLPELNAFYSDLHNINATCGHSYSESLKFKEIENILNNKDNENEQDILNNQDNNKNQVIEYLKQHIKNIRIIRSPENQSTLERIKDIQNKSKIPGEKERGYIKKESFWNKLRRKKAISTTDDINNRLNKKINSLKQTLSPFQKPIYVSNSLLSKKTGPYTLIKINNPNDNLLRIYDNTLDKIPEKSEFYFKNKNDDLTYSFSNHKKNIPMWVQKHNFCVELNKLIENQKNENITKTALENIKKQYSQALDGYFSEVKNIYNDLMKIAIERENDHTITKPRI